MAIEANMFSAGDLVDVPISPTERGKVQELPLPHNFTWGTATAAYQIEGAANEDGKGPSIWDAYSHLEPSRTNGDNGDVACDHFHQMADDVALMASLGTEVYRFSISWPRIIPLGGRHDTINERGIAFYNSLIDQLLAHNITPVATLYHWDGPQELYNRYKLFLDTQEFTADFAHFAHLCFTRFGDRVKRWVTFNEPYIISIFGHLNGTLAPGHCREAGTDTKSEPWYVGHTIIIAHATVVEMYVNEFSPSQGGDISMVLNGHFYEPYNPSNALDREAAERRLVFYIGWFGDPVFRGEDYPPIMRTYLGARLPVFTAQEYDLLRRTAPMNGFYGMNHYSTKYARALSSSPDEDDWTGNIKELSTNVRGETIGPVSAVEWLRVAPDGFRKLLNWVWHRYHLPVIVTENGCPCPGEAVVSTAINDSFRQSYFGLYLDAISQAIYEDGVPVLGYYAWSLMDNYEWSAGYGTRFGIIHVDFETLERTVKDSAYYLRETMKRRRETLSK